MTKVEGFIKDCTKNFSNDIEQNVDGLSYLDYVPWLTTEEARKVAKIAREETIEEVCEWLKKNVTYIHPRKETEECVVNIARLKEDLGL